MSSTSLMYRGRNLKSSRSLKKRRDSEEDAVKLDLAKAPHDNIRDILYNIIQREGVSKGRCLSYLTYLVKIAKQSDHEQLGFTKEELFLCLRVALFNEAFEIRAAGFRAIRFLLIDSKSVEALCKVKVDFFICRSLDIVLDNRVERVQAMRLCRKILCIHPELFPRSLTSCLVSLAKTGLEEKDPLLRACLGTLGELALLNPSSCFNGSGLMDALINNILLCSPTQPQLPESLLGVILFMLNHPATREPLLKELKLERLMVPLTDGQPSLKLTDYATSYFQEMQERESRMKMSQIALTIVLHSWPGFIALCNPENFAIKTLVDMLTLPYPDSRRSVLELFYDLFALQLPEWTSDFDLALLSADTYAWRESWQLYEGFVASEGRDILPHLAESRPNLVQNYLALLLLAFINAGILEALVEVVATDESPEMSVFATVLLGEILHLSSGLLPSDYTHKCQSLPSLVALAISQNADPIQKSSASSSISRLDKIHLLKKRGPIPASLFLDHLMQRTSPMSTSSSSKRTTNYSYPNAQGRQKQDKAAFYHWAVSKAKLQGCMRKETDDVVLQSVKDTQVLTKSYENWDLALISSMLKTPGDILKKLEETSCRTFIRILVEFFKPSTTIRPCFSRLDLTAQNSQLQDICCVGCNLVDFLLEAEESKSNDMLQEFLSSLVECLTQVNVENVGIDAVLSPSRVAQSCQFYFLFIGHLSAHNKGKKLLETSRVFELLLEIVGRPKHDAYVSLVVSSFDYTKDEFSRTLLNKVLTSASDNGRLYATNYLRVLLRASVPDFRKWGIELLVNQLYDKSQAVSLASLDILEEVCELQENLESLISLRPSLLHLGDRGLLLLIRFLSLPNGFKFLSNANFINSELDKWNKVNYLKYVRIVESSLNEAITRHRKGEDGTYGRRSNIRYVLGECYLPPHMYGQLCSHQEGFDLVTQQLHDPLNAHFQRVLSTKSTAYLSEVDVLELKASLWTIGNVAMTTLGLRVIVEANVITSIVLLAAESSVLTLRGTCFYVLGLIGSTADGADYLSQYGWEAVRRSHHQKWPVLAQALAQHQHLKQGGFSQNSTESLTDEWMFKNVRYHSWSISSTGSHISEWLTKGLMRDRIASRVRQDSESSNVSDEDMVAFSSMERSRSFHAREESDVHSYTKVIATKNQPTSTPTPSYRTLPKNICLSPLNNKSSIQLSPPSPDIRPRSSSENPPKPSPITALYSSKDESSESNIRNEVISEESPKKVQNKTLTLSIQSSRHPSTDGSTNLTIKSRSGSCTDSTTSGVSSCESNNANPTKSVAHCDFQDSSAASQSVLSPIPSSASLNTLASFRRNCPVVLSSSQMPNPSVVSTGQSASCASYSSYMYQGSISSVGGVSSIPATNSTYGFTSARDARGYATLRAIQRKRRVQSMTDEGVTLRNSTLALGFLEKESSYSVSDKESFSSDQGEITDSERVSETSRRGSSQETSDPIFQTCPDFYMGLSLPVSLNFISSFPVSSKTPTNFEDPKMEDLGHSPSWIPHTTKDMNEITSDDDGLELHTVENCVACCWPQFKTTGDVEDTKTKSPSCESFGKTAMDRLKKVLLRKEVLHFVTNLSSSVGVQNAEQGLLSLKQKFPTIFNDTCLYSEICLQSTIYNIRLSVRRFLQELFMDAPFKELICQAEELISSPVHNSFFLTLSEAELPEETSS